VRVAIITDIRLYREGLRALLARAGVDVIRTTDDGDSEDAGVSCVLATRPDVALLDLSMPSWHDDLRALINSGCETCIVALGVLESEPDVVACAEAGVAGYVPRDASVDDLVRTMHRVLRGEVVCPPRIVGGLFRRLGVLALERAPAASVQKLTARELQIVDLIDEGLSNKQIARRLNIEPSTVKNHVHNVLEKLEVRRRADAAACVRHGAAHTRI
jgi:two-component system nitrate/nitrite response regulator NarL